MNSKKNKNQVLWLILGIGFVGAALGYMVGGSQTPVVGIIVPAIFGLIITSVGFLSDSSVDKKLDSIVDSIKADKLEQIKPVLENIKNETIRTPEYMGKLLIVFTILYVSGSVIGTRARVEEWFAKPAVPPSAVPQKQRQLPWMNSDHSPTSTEDAATWIAIQEKLTSLGYTETQVQELYKIQVAEWRANPKKEESSALEILTSIETTPFEKNDSSPFEKRDSSPFEERVLSSPFLKLLHDRERHVDHK